MKSYSMPSRVVGCAKHLGLNVSIYMDPGFYSTVLKLAYRNEMSACESQGVIITEGKSPGPVGNQRELVVLSTFGIGLHYVLRRPTSYNGKAYMDPADGADHTDFSALNTGLKVYKQTGISIMLS
jgi:cysteine protease IpaJ